MTTDDVRADRRPALDKLDDVPDDMPQEEQARLLVEPTFDHQIENEDELMMEEFGLPARGGFGRVPVYDAEYAGGGGS